MKTQMRWGMAAALASLATAAFAQGQGGGRGFGNRMMGGMAMGTIRQIDAARNAIQVQMMGGGDATDRWVVLSDQTALTRQMEGKLTDLKPNDAIVVSGIPTSIQASQIQMGEMPAGPFGPGGGFRGGGPGGPGGGPGGPGGGPNAGPGGRNGSGSQAMTQSTGTVVTVSPLVIMLPGNIKASVTADASTRVTKVVKTTLADLKPGDTIRAFGQPDENGNVNAMRIDVGVDLTRPMGFGGGGFGGGGRRGGAGGGAGGARRGGAGGANRTPDSAS